MLEHNLKIKIIHIITKLELGGAQLNTLYTVDHLDKNFFDPVLITGSEGILLPDALKLKGVKTYIVEDLIREISPIKDIKAFLKIKNILKKISKNVGNNRIIVHTHSSKAGIIGRWAAWFSSIPVILHTFHGFGFNDYQTYTKRSFFIFMERVSSKISDVIIAVSKANMTKALSLGIGNEKQFKLIRSGIKISDYSQTNMDKIEARQKLNLPVDSPLIGCVSCFKPQKNLVHFVRLAKEIKNNLSEAKFVLVGDGELREKIESEIKTLGLEDSFYLLGWRKDIPVIMRSFDILVHTSLWEGLPRIFPEAMASGVPIITTRVDGAEEAVINGKNGYLFSLNQTSAMAEKIVQILSHPELLKQLASEGKTMSDEFCIDLMVKQQETLYKSFF